jgi:hypothetical protein
MAHVSARIAVRGRPRNLAERAGEQIREDAFRLDDAAVAEARLPRRLRQTVDKRYSSPARLERERRGDADYSSAKHNDVDRVRRHGMGVFLTGRASLNCGAPYSILDFRSYRPRLEGTNRKLRRQ